MDDSRSDAALVAAFLGGDRGVLGAIYDRYSAGLFDLATGMLRDPHDAADVVQDVFVAAARSLDRLREPDRLRPWLFAIARHEVFRRTRSRTRVRATDFTDPSTAATLGAAVMSAPADPDEEGGRAVALDLAAAVRDAAAGLEARDQLVLELVARQGLAGRDLADALGVTEPQCHVLVHRMRERVRRSLGALTVARMGRADCPPLRELLGDWDGTFSVLVRKRVARHIESCSVCTRTSTRYAVIPLIGMLPVAVGPADLRARVLAAALRGSGQPDVGGRAETAYPPTPRASWMGAARGYRFDAPGGFPRSDRRRGGLVVAMAAVALLVGGTALWSARLETVPAVVTAATTGATSAASAPPPTPGAAMTAEGSPSIGQPTMPPTIGPGTSSPPPPAPGPGRLVLATTSVNLGGGTRAVLGLSNTGGRSLTWSVGAGLAPFVLSVTTGVLSPGATTTVQVGIDRTGLPEGQARTRFEVRSTSAGGGFVTAMADVEHSPTIGLVNAPPTLLTCPWSVAPIVSVTVADESDVAAVRLTWSGPGSPGGVPLTLGTAGRWSGRLTLDQVVGSWAWQVQAVDARGNTGAVAGSTLVQGSC